MFVWNTSSQVRLCAASLWVPPLPPTVQRHVGLIGLIGVSKFPNGVSVSVWLWLWLFVFKYQLCGELVTSPVCMPPHPLDGRMDGWLV